MRFRPSTAVVLIAMLVLTPLWSIAGANSLASDLTRQGTPSSDQSPELVVDGQRYLFDREVPIDISGLEERADEDGNPVFAKSEDPLAAIYTPVPGDDGQGARYLPENLDNPDAQCPSELIDAAIITADGGSTTYVPAGPEPDITIDTLTQIELVTAWRHDLRGEHELVATSRRGATLTARRLAFRQRFGPEVKLHVAESNRRAVRELGVRDALAFDFGAVAARVVDDRPLAVGVFE